MAAEAEPVAPAEAGDFKALSKDEQRCAPPTTASSAAPPP